MKKLNIVFSIFIFCFIYLSSSSAIALEKVQIVIGGAGSIYYLQPDVAKALRFFENEGLEVEILNVKGGSEAAISLLSGSVDFTFNDFPHVLKAMQQGKRLPMIASIAKQIGVTVLVSEKYRTKIRSVKDLKGYRIGVASPGSGTHTIAIFMLKKFGLSPDDAQFIGTGVGPMVPALLEDKIQAGVFGEPHTSILMTSGKAFPLIDLATTKGTKDLLGYNDAQSRGLLTRPDVIAKKADICQKIVNAIVRTNNWIASHSPEEIANVMPPELVTDKKIYIAALDHWKEVFPADSLVTKERVEAAIFYLKAIGVIEEGFKAEPSSMYDMRFVNKAHEKYPYPK